MFSVQLKRRGDTLIVYAADDSDDLDTGRPIGFITIHGRRVVAVAEINVGIAADARLFRACAEFAYALQVDAIQFLLTVWQREFVRARDWRVA